MGLCHQKERQDEEGNVMQGKPLSAVGTGEFRGARDESGSEVHMSCFKKNDSVWLIL